jgi:hypothetical protein
MDATLRTTALWATVIQGLFALTWAMYVAFLPGLLAAAGFDARFVLVFVLFDQVVFAVADWASGIYADRLARVLGRIGPALAGVAVLSSAALLALPWIARLGAPWLLVAATGVWTATSSALRAPVFTLLGRAGGALRPAGAISVAVVGIGIANAVAPMVTRALAQVDPRLALGACAASLALAALFASTLEKRSKPAAPGAVGEPRRLAPALFIAGLVAVAAFGVQVHTIMLGARVAKTGVEWAAGWTPVFWIGFALGLAVAALIGRAPGAAPPLRAAAQGLLVGALAMGAALAAAHGALFFGAQAVAGGAWALFTAMAVRAALRYGGAQGFGSPLGLIFAALAVGAIVRVALTAAGLHTGAWLAWAPVIAWAAAGGVLWVFASGGSARGAGLQAPARR